MDFIAALILDVGKKSELLVVGDGAVYSGGEVYFVHYFAQDVHKNNAGGGGDGVGMCDSGDFSDLLICGICECKWRYSHKRAVAVGLLVGEAAPFVECGGGSIADIKYLVIDGVVSVVEPVAKRFDMSLVSISPLQARMLSQVAISSDVSSENVPAGMPCTPPDVMCVHLKVLRP